MLKIDLASRISSCLLTAYLYAVPSKHFEQLVSYSSRILPPLTDWDNIKLFVIIPIIGASLTRNDFGSVHALLDMLPYLVEYCLNNDNHSTTRTHAASLSFVIIERLSKLEEICPARKFFVDLLLPLFARTCRLHLERADKSWDEFSNVLDVISLMVWSIIIFYRHYQRYYIARSNLVLFLGSCFSRSGLFVPPNG